VRVPASAKADVLEAAQVREALEAARVRLGDAGRINLRPSGTEPLVRVMVEAADEGLVERLAQEVAASVEAAAR